jgi:hypothetical protein
MNLVRNRWVYGLLFGAMISVSVGGIVNSLAPLAIAQESAEEAASTAEASPEKAADKTTPAEATDGDATAEALASYIRETDYNQHPDYVYLCSSCYFHASRICNG